MQRQAECLRLAWNNIPTIPGRKASPSFGAGWKRALCKRKARLQPTKVVTMSPWRSISSGKRFGIDSLGMSANPKAPPFLYVVEETPP